MANYKWILLGSLMLFELQGYAQDQKTVAVEQALTQFNDQQPVFKLKAEQLENKNRHLHFYALTAYREGVQPVVSPVNVNFLTQTDQVHGTHRIKMYNLSIIDLLTYGSVKSDQVILEVKDPSKYRYEPKYGSKQNWLRKNAYCYELLLPENTANSIDVVRNHLCSIFKLKCGYQKRLIKNIEKNIFVITEIN